MVAPSCGRCGEPHDAHVFSVCPDQVVDGKFYVTAEVYRAPAPNDVAAPNGWREGEPHPKPDPNRCPSCGTYEEIRETGKRISFQFVTLSYDHDGLLEPVSYSSYDTGDDTFDVAFECAGCGTEWSTIYALGYAQRFRQALEDREALAVARQEAAEQRDPDDEVTIAIYEATADAFRTALAIWCGNGEA